MAINLKTVGIKAEVLDDLASRFLINLSNEDKEDPIKLCSHIELAHWFYLDLMRPEDPTLPGCNLKEFMSTIFKHCPWLISKSTARDLDKLISEWKTHKYRKPVRGAIILNQDWTKCLLVQGYPSCTSWGFPKGKLEEGEEDEAAAIREVYEETGFDIRGIIKKDSYLEASIHDSNARMYLIPGVPDKTQFQPKTRKEIGKIQWFSIRDLPSYKKDMASQQALGMNSNNFFMIIPFIGRLRRWIQQNKKSKGREISATFKGSNQPLLPAPSDGQKGEPGSLRSLSNPHLDNTQRGGATQPVLRSGTSPVPLSSTPHHPHPHPRSNQSFTAPLIPSQPHPAQYNLFPHPSHSLSTPPHPHPGHSFLAALGTPPHPHPGHSFSAALGTPPHPHPGHSFSAALGTPPHPGHSFSAAPGTPPHPHPGHSLSAALSIPPHPQYIISSHPSHSLSAPLIPLTHPRQTPPALLSTPSHISPTLLTSPISPSLICHPHPNYSSSPLLSTPSHPHHGYATQQPPLADLPHLTPLHPGPVLLQHPMEPNPRTTYPTHTALGHPPATVGQMTRVYSVGQMPSLLYQQAKEPVREEFKLQAQHPARGTQSVSLSSHYLHEEQQSPLTLPAAAQSPRRTLLSTPQGKQPLNDTANTAFHLSLQPAKHMIKFKFNREAILSKLHT